MVVQWPDRCFKGEVIGEAHWKEVLKVLGLLHADVRHTPTMSLCSTWICSKRRMSPAPDEEDQRTLSRLPDLLEDPLASLP